jgi:hypothetical protein
MGREARRPRVTRVLLFAATEPKSQKRLELCFAAVMLGAPREARSIDVLRREARLLDAFESVSVLNPDGAALVNGMPARAVNPDATLRLEQPDWELLRKYVELTPWAPLVSRDVVDVVDWLGAAAEV